MRVALSGGLLMCVVDCKGESPETGDTAEPSDSGIVDETEVFPMDGWWEAEFEDFAHWTTTTVRFPEPGRDAVCARTRRHAGQGRRNQ
jgi:hypothetical protein